MREGVGASRGVRSALTLRRINEQYNGCEAILETTPRDEASITRLDEGDLDIILYATQAAMKGDRPPRVGEDVLSTFWLQGYFVA